MREKERGEGEVFRREEVADVSECDIEEGGRERGREGPHLNLQQDSGHFRMRDLHCRVIRCSPSRIIRLRPSWVLPPHHFGLQDVATPTILSEEALV